MIFFILAVHISTLSTVKMLNKRTNINGNYVHTRISFALGIRKILTALEPVTRKVCTHIFTFRPQEQQGRSPHRANHEKAQKFIICNCRTTNVAITEEIDDPSCNHLQHAFGCVHKFPIPDCTKWVFS